MCAELTKKYTKAIHADYAGQRIDNYLITHYKGVPKTRLYRAIRKGEVRINGKRIKQTYRLQENDMIRLPPLKTPDSQKQSIVEQDLDVTWLKTSILYDDDCLLVINKPAGLAVHGGTGVHLSLMDYLKQLYPNQFLKLVHRIDMATSGCLLIAKNRKTLLALQQQFKDRSVKKIYQSINIGRLAQSPTTITTKLIKDRDAAVGLKVKADPSGKEAVSIFKELESGQKVSLNEVEIKTGRMHQIRVQSQIQAMPILGDDKYGDREINRYLAKQKHKRMYLHCSKMTFQHLDKPMTVHAANETWAEDFMMLDKLLTKYHSMS